MRISGFAFLIVGIAVAIISFIMVSQGQKMKLFLYAGIALAVFGAWRIYIDRSAAPEDERRAKLAAQLPAQRHIHEIPRVCSSCHTKNHPKANYCGHCGNRL